MTAYTLHCGDCIEVMRGMADASVDAIVCDPPYGLEFMGKEWDGADGFRRSLNAADAGRDNTFGRMSKKAPEYRAGRLFQEWCEAWATEALRVLKPGGHLLAFSGSRTYHRMTCAIEDAGFEIRDQIMWVYGSGFPKSHNLAGEHEGWGTALKPSHEPIAVARKPFKGSVAANVLAHGTGAINIDACRVAPTGESRERVSEASQDSRYTSAGATNFAATPGPRGGDAAGRWPANLIHDGSAEVVALFPSQAGASAPVRGTEPSSMTKSVYGQINRQASNAFHADTGSAARFFYCAKTCPADRHEGLDAPGPQFKKGSTLRDAENLGSDRKGNHHPTVKPTDLMTYLVRLITPPGGLVLDPFMGSGSTGKACMREGMRFIGIDMDAAYVEIARARIVHELALPVQMGMFA